MLKHSSTPPEGWIEARLFEICTMKSGNGITSSLLDEHSKYPCYGGNGIRGYTRNYTHDGTYALIGRQGALCGNVNSASGKFFASEHAIVVAAKNNIDINWLTHVLQEGNLNQYSESSAQPGLSVSKILTLPVTVPPLAEQLKIARSLSDVDDLLAKLDQLIAKKSDIKKGAMQELLTGKRRLPGFAEAWQTCTLGDILTVRHGKLQGEVESPTGAFPILATSGEIGRSNKYLYDKPSVLIGRKGTIDVPQYIEQPFWTIDTLFYTEIHKGSPKYIYHLFNTIDWRSYNEASGVPSLSRSTIEKIVIELPSIDEQIAISNLLCDLDADIEVLRAKRTKFSNIKQGMMQQLLTGKIRLV